MEGIQSLEGWKTFWENNKDNGEIRNEYDEVISVEQMLKTITDRQFYCREGLPPLRHHELQRHYGKEVVWQGEGDWDYIDCEFS